MSLEIRDIAWYKAKANEINKTIDEAYTIGYPSIPSSSIRTMFAVIVFANSHPFRFLGGFRCK